MIQNLDEKQLCSQLHMYTLNEILEMRIANDYFYSFICEEYKNLDVKNVIKIPDKLIDINKTIIILSEKGASGELFLGQTCGWPVVQQSNSYKILAIPHYNAEGCDGFFYSSVIITHSNNNEHFSLNDIMNINDSHKYRVAINSRNSCSGYLLLAATLGKNVMKKLSKNILWTGSHVNSIDAINTFRADFAAIDCVTFELLRKNRPDLLKSIRIIGYSVKAPSLPYVTSIYTPTEVVKNIKLAIQNVIKKMNESLNQDYRKYIKSILLIDDFTFDLNENSNSQQLVNFEDYYRNYMISLQAKASYTDEGNVSFINDNINGWIQDVPKYIRPLLPLDESYIKKLIDLIKLERNKIFVNQQESNCQSCQIWKVYDGIKFARIIFPGGIESMNDSFFRNDNDEIECIYNIICFIGNRYNVEDCLENDVDIVQACWSIDAKLTQQLNSSVVLAYVSSELQPGGDWGNIVLFKQGQSVETSNYFNDKINVGNDGNIETHQFAQKQIAPKYYQNVRIHRVQLVVQSNIDRFCFIRTLFFQYSTKNNQMNSDRQIVNWNNKEII